MALRPAFSRWIYQPTVASKPAPEFRWDVLINQGFPGLNAVTGGAVTPRGAAFQGAGGNGRNWQGVNALEQINTPMPTTSTGYTMLWVGAFNTINTSGTAIVRTNGGGFRFEPYTTFGGVYVTASHTSVVTLNAPGPWVYSFDTRPWVVILSYDGATATFEVMTPNREYGVATTSASMLDGTGTLDLGGTSGVFGHYLIGYAQRPMPAQQRQKYLTAPWTLFEQKKYFGWSVATGSVALTGSSISVSSGTLTPANAVNLTGQAFTAASGTLTPSQAIGVTLTGLFATFTPNGLLKPEIAIALTGLATTVNQGTLVPTQDTLVALTGLSSTFSGGSLVPSLAVQVTGLVSTFSQDTLIPLVGNSVLLSGQVITVNTGSVQANLAIALLGQSITTSRGTLTPSAGGNVSVNLTGNLVTISSGTITPTLGNPPETIEFSWSKEGAVFTFNKNTVLFEFD